MTEIYFYHLERQPLEMVLPTLLQKSLARGWRALVKASSPERVEALDGALWTFGDESFLPHGRAAEPHAADQPILLTEGDGNPNGAAALFLVDGAEVPSDIAGYARVSLLLDGGSEEALAAGRRVFRALREAGHDLSYWQQDGTGPWRRQA